MRWIDRGDYEPSEEWLKSATEVTKMLKSAKTKEDRTQIIKDYSYLWGILKDELLELSNGKCWYSEAKKTVSFFDVDHFRPKNNVKHLDWDYETSNIDEGYWWLAFDWRNYRPSGEICNRKKTDNHGVCRGKQDYFPLVKRCKHAYCPDDILDDEMPYLLDPTLLEDVVLITFDNNGEPYPAAPKDSQEYTRAEITIKLLYLDFPILNDARIEVWNYCERLINEAENLMRYRDAVSLIIEKRRKDIIKDLIKLISTKSEFSSVAIACLNRDNTPLWAKKLLSA